MAKLSFKLEPSMAVYMFEYLVVANERNFKVNNSKKNYCIFMKYLKVQDKSCV